MATLSQFSVLGFVRNGYIVTLFASLLPAVAVGQPSELYRCVTQRGGAPTCWFGDVLVVDICAGTTFHFMTYRGRAAWYPLKNVGDVIIEIETRGGYGTTFPLFIEIVPLPDSLPPNYCFSGMAPGVVVGYVEGGAQNCGGGWERFGPLTLGDIVPDGANYALQLVGFRRSERGIVQFSPAINCVRLTPVTTVVERTTWTQVKRLLR